MEESFKWLKKTLTMMIWEYVWQNLKMEENLYNIDWKAYLVIQIDQASVSLFRSSGSLMTVIPVRFGDLGRWNFWSSCLIAWMIGPVGSPPDPSPPLPDGVVESPRVGRGSWIRTCFRGEVHSDQQLEGFLSCLSCSFNSSSDVEPKVKWHDFKTV